MKLFVAHSSGFDYQNELYKPLRASILNEEFELFLPLELGTQRITHGHLKSCNYLLAEVSYPSTGQGIELGWAEWFRIPIIYFHKKGKLASLALDKLSQIFIEYENEKQMVDRLYSTIRRTIDES